MAEPHPAATEQMSIEELISLVATARGRASDAQKAADEAKKEQKALEAALIERMDEVGTTRAGSATHNVSLSEETVPTVVDWEAFLGWAAENDYLGAMVQRRVNAPPYRELLAQGEEVPGLEPFTNRKMSFTKAK